MAGLNHLKDIYEKKGKEFLEALLNKEVIVNEKMDGAFFGAQRNCGNSEEPFEFFKRNTKLTGVDRVLSSYYNPALKHFDELSADSIEKLPCNYHFGMEYFSSPTAQSIQYDRLPKNHLILSYIHILDEAGEQAETIQDKAELDKWADILDIERPPIIFQGKLTDDQKEKILDFVYTPLDELVGKFKTASFTKYIINVLNPELRTSFLRDTADKDIEGIVFRFYEPGGEDSVFLAKLVDPVFQARAKEKAQDRVAAPKTDDYIWIMTADLMNFIETYSQADLDVIKPDGTTFEKRYIQIINAIFKDFVQAHGSKYRGLEITTPEFLNKPEFDVNRALINDDMVIRLIDSDKTLKELYRVFLNTFRKKNIRVSSTFFNKTMKETLKSQIAKVQLAAEDKLNEAFFPTFNQFFGTDEDASDFFSQFQANQTKKKDIEIVIYLDKFQPLSKEHEKIAANIKGKYDVPCLMVAYHPGQRSSAFPMSSETVKNSIDRLSKTSDYVVGGSTVDSVGIDELIGAIGQGYSIKAIATNLEFVPDLVIDLNRINKRAPYAKIPSQLKVVEVPKIELEADLVNSVKTQDFVLYKNITSKPLHSEFYNMTKEIEESLLTESISVAELDKKKSDLLDLIIDAPYNEALYKKIEKLLKRTHNDVNKELFDILGTGKGYKDLAKTIVSIADDLDQDDDLLVYLDNPTITFEDITNSPNGNLKTLFDTTGLSPALYDQLFNLIGSVGNVNIGRGEILMSILIKDAVNAGNRDKGDIKIKTDLIEIKASGDNFRLTGQSGTGMGADTGNYIRKGLGDLFTAAKQEVPEYFENSTAFTPSASATPRKEYFSQGITAAVQASTKEDVVEILATGFNLIYKNYKDELTAVFNGAIAEDGTFNTGAYLNGVLKIEFDRYLQDGTYFMAVSKHTGDYVLINGKITDDQLKYFKIEQANNIRPKSTSSDSLLGIDLNMDSFSTAPQE
jgi:hypothetical protein